MRFFSKKSPATEPSPPTAEPITTVPSSQHSITSDDHEKPEPAEAIVSRNSSEVNNPAEAKIEALEHEAMTRQYSKDYPSGLKLALISTALCLSVLCMALDNTIISTAIPRSTDQFNS
jgi:hypothetical protein